MRRLWLLESVRARQVRLELARLSATWPKERKDVAAAFPLVGSDALPTGVAALIIDTAQIVYDPATQRWSAPPGAVTIVLA